jgi:hypothetical protein
MTTPFHAPLSADAFGSNEAFNSAVTVQTPLPEWLWLEQFINAANNQEDALIELLEQQEPLVVIRLNALTEPSVSLLLKQLGYGMGFVAPDHTPAYAKLVQVLSWRFPALKQSQHAQKGLLLLPSQGMNWAFWYYHLAHWQYWQQEALAYTQQAITLYVAYYLNNKGVLPGNLSDTLSVADLQALQARITVERKVLQFIQWISFKKAMQQAKLA